MNIVADEQNGTTGAQFGEAMPPLETDEQGDVFADEELDGEETDDEAEGEDRI
jgi:hypothetical protein